MAGAAGVPDCGRGDSVTEGVSLMSAVKAEMGAWYFSSQDVLCGILFLFPYCTAYWQNIFKLLSNQRCYNLLTLRSIEETVLFFWLF